MTTITKITIDGVVYESPDKMPPDVREKYDDMQRRMQDLMSGPLKDGMHKTQISISSTTKQDTHFHADAAGKTPEGNAELGPLPPKPMDIRARIIMMLVLAGALLMLFFAFMKP